MENLERQDSAGEDEAAISDFENEGGLVVPNKSRESKNKKENLVDSALTYCRMVHGKLLCRIGDHDYIEVSRESFHKGEDEVVYLRCSRPDCPRPKAWTEWRRGERVM